MKEFFKNLKFVWGHTKKQKGNLVKTSLLSVISVVASIVIPIVSAQVIIKLTSNEMYQMLYIALVILVLELLSQISFWLSEKYTLKITENARYNLTKCISSNILMMKNSVLDLKSSGEFLNRINDDTNRLGNIFQFFTYQFFDIVMGLGIFVAIFTINKIVFIYLLIFVVLLLFIEKIRLKNINKKEIVLRKDSEKVSGLIGELVRGVRDIKMLNSEKPFLKKINQKIENNRNLYFEKTKYNVNMENFRDCIIDLKKFLTIGLIAYLVLNKKINIATALVIYNFANQINWTGWNVSVLFDKVQDFNISSSRIKEIIESKEFAKEEFGSKNIPKVKGDFEFKNVSFSYADNKVLDNLSFKIKANEKIASVGKSGAGKTTIFNLLSKMYDNYSGEILIDDVDIKELDKDTIRGNITIISQNPYIFNFTIKENFQLIKEDVTDEEIIKACKLACLDDFINELPLKYDTLIGEGGINLSGGQKQRLAIARALIQKTEIILFDEATSALDNETQKQITTAINNLKGYTIIIIAHRLSTIIESDRILFLNNGKIETSGTHNDLLKSSLEYKHLYETEISN
jgi:ABC-type bacteriocin/lantibiotic exporter with double-glycine peptidase domain